MKKIVLVNVDFRDAYTGELHAAGSQKVMTDERIAEIKSVNPEFVSVIGLVDEPTASVSTDTDEVIEEVDVVDEATSTPPKIRKGKKSK